MDEKSKRSFSKNVISASFWSMITEIVYKAINPIIFLILARLLSPKDYGMISIATILISFIMIISDLGLSKAIIQKEYDEKKLKLACTVAFWSNLFIAVIFFIILLLTSGFISKLFGEPNSSIVIKVMSVQIIINSLVSVHNAIIQRNLNFKLLFYVRIITVFIPIISTLPLAFYGFGYWAIITGSILSSIANAIAMWKIVDWRPGLYFDILVLLEMLKFSLWNTAESMLSWGITWIDVIIVGAYLTTRELGLYTTSTNFLQVLFTLLLSPILPVFFSSLSRIQNNNIEFKRFFIIVHKVICMISFPLGMSLFLYGDIIEIILFGDNWKGLGKVIGILGLMRGLTFIFTLNGEGYRAKGRADANTIIMVVNLLIYIPVFLTAIKYGFEIFVLARAIIAFVQIPYHFYVSKRILNISIKDIYNNIRWILLGIISMLLLSMVSKYVLPNIVQYNIISFVLCICLYILCLIPERDIIMKLLQLIMKREKQLIS
jgi:O-antigen/teichoic acid export membrane protein